ncbi:copper resistance protein CopC [Micromonospora sp. NPDC049559]|uniref:copper resistance CopC family protein n=1 Tax=Micromonospora sp. NPDC049559 TaxID=3155923 RepID=UPI0034460950
MRSTLASVGRRAARTLVVCLLAGVALAVTGSSASAHGQLAMSKPVKDSTVTAPLKQLELYFTEQPASNAHFTVTAPSGARVDAGWTSGQPQRLDQPVQEYFLVNGKFEPRVYNMGFPAMLTVSHWPEKGTYSATYLSVASDGEPVRGTVSFRYDGPVGAAPAGWVPPNNGPSETLLRAVEGGHDTGPDPTTGPTASPAATGGNASKPAADSGGSPLPWLLPALLVVAAALVVLAAARKKPAAAPVRGPKTTGRAAQGKDRAAQGKDRAAQGSDRAAPSARAGTAKRRGGGKAAGPRKGTSTRRR